ncbi:DUF742 domain-containing protein [Flexivirga caeni]|uniref:DUF742 domain-containing protein n=1 Tax=Flexivirga caeni TaxID=2294115 RepID=A0A3M9MEG4_9MICO|nr:DUF742 domain-containing protein [Flexivirga caeni]RNI23951.1 DUF742 domain-containing protein [Flexivirga caeni]
MTEDPPEWDDTDEPVASVVRPYTFTAGRTTSRVDVPLEATVELTEEGRARHWPAHDPNSRIIDLCSGELLSVAEIAARADLALGVARVLVGDLAAEGSVQLQQTMTDSTSNDERISLIERTLRGLRDL